MNGVSRGHFLVIRTDGSQELYAERASVRRLQQLLGVATLDSVTLERRGGRPTVVMMVDDAGMIDNKLVNGKATDLYHGVCKLGTIWAIRGDVAIVHDGDFA